MERVRSQSERGNTTSPQEAAQRYVRKERVEKEAPTNPEEIWACFVNAFHLELGTLAILNLSDTLPGKTAYDLAKDVVPTATVREKSNRSNQIKNYLEKIFIDVALVARESYLDTAIGKQLTFYSLTSFGKRLQGVGYFLLSSLTELNKKHKTDLALPQILTKSASGMYRKGEKQEKLPPTRRAPYIRTKVIEELVQLPDEETTQTDIIRKKLGVDKSAVTKHLQDLKQAGLISYQSVSPEEKGKFIYTASAEKSFPDEIHIDHRVSYGVESMVFNHIKTVINDNPTNPLDAHSLFEFLYPVYCSQRVIQGKQPVKKETFKQDISRILGYLRRNSHLHSEFVISKQRSHAALTPFGKDVAGILSQAKKACGDPSLSQNMEREFKRSFPSFVLENTATLLERQQKYGEAQGSEEQRVSVLLHLLRNNPQGLRSSEIDRSSGILMHHYLARIKDYGIIEQQWSPSKGEKRKNRGTASIYTLSPKTQEILEQNPDISYEELKLLVASNT